MAYLLLFGPCVNGKAVTGLGVPGPALARWIQQRVVAGCRYVPHRPLPYRDIAEGLIRWVGLQT